MMLTDEKVTNLTHVLLKGLLEKGVIRLKAEEAAVRRAMKRAIREEMKIAEDIDLAVRKKLQSMSRRPTEGSPEWDLLYKKFFREEEVRKGRA